MGGVAFGFRGVWKLLANPEPTAENGAEIEYRKDNQNLNNKTKSCPQDPNRRFIKEYQCKEKKIY